MLRGCHDLVRRTWSPLCLVGYKNVTERDRNATHHWNIMYSCWGMFQKPVLLDKKQRTIMHIHCPVAAGSGLGYTRLFATLSRFILHEAVSWLNLQWPGREGGGGGPGWRGQVPSPYGQAEKSSTLHWLPLHSTLNTTAHLTDRMGLLSSDFPSVGHTRFAFKVPTTNFFILLVFLNKLLKFFCFILMCFVYI